MLNNFIDNTKHLNIYGIVVLQNGKKIGEHHWKEEIKRNQFSITKSFVSTAVGMAIDEGLLTLEDRVVEYFREDLPEKLSVVQKERLEKLTIEDLLMMAVGYEEARLMQDRKTLEDPNWSRVALGIPLIDEAKERFKYTNATAYLAGVIVEKVTGELLVDYLMPRLFEPLGIKRPEYESCPLGHVFGASGLMLTVNELSRFGQLYLQKGEYNGKQLISKEWIERATKKHIDTCSEEKDKSFGYGYFFRRGSHNSYYACGKLSQLCIILEDKNAVITINAEEGNTQGIMDCIWETIYPVL